MFAVTRVPVQTRIDDLEDGESLATFLDEFPGVRREHAVAVLELARAALDSHAPAASRPVAGVAAEDVSKGSPRVSVRLGRGDGWAMGIVRPRP